MGRRAQRAHAASGRHRAVRRLSHSRHQPGAVQHERPHPALALHAHLVIYGRIFSYLCQNIFSTQRNRVFRHTFLHFISNRLSIMYIQLSVTVSIATVFLGPKQALLRAKINHVIYFTH